MSEDDPSSLAEQFEEALEWEWGEEEEEILLPYSCDLENPEICESCQ